MGCVAFGLWRTITDGAPHHLVLVVRNVSDRGTISDATVVTEGSRSDANDR
jgi:hypothetical protein